MWVEAAEQPQIDPRKTASLHGAVYPREQGEAVRRRPIPVATDDDPQRARGRPARDIERINPSELILEGFVIAVGDRNDPATSGIVVHRLHNLPDRHDRLLG